MKLCVEPDCNRQRSQRRNARYCTDHMWENLTREQHYARMHRQRLDRAQRRNHVGVECLICNTGPYAKIGPHIGPAHGVTRREYRRMFPGADLVHPEHRVGYRLDAKFNGAGPGKNKGKRARTCSRGHALRGANVLIGSHGRRTCKRCHRDAVREGLRAWRRRKSEASGTKLCECGKCGIEIPRIGLGGRPRRYVHGHWRSSQPSSQPSQPSSQPCVSAEDGS